MKKNFRRFAPVALVLIGLATLSFMAKETITLRLHPQQGKSYTINSKATSMSLMEVQGQTMNMSQTMETNQSFTIKEAKPAEVAKYFPNTSTSRKPPTRKALSNHKLNP